MREREGGRREKERKRVRVLRGTLFFSMPPFLMYSIVYSERLQLRSFIGGLFRSFAGEWVSVTITMQWRSTFHGSLYNLPTFCLSNGVLRLRIDMRLPEED